MNLPGIPESVARFCTSEDNFGIADVAVFEEQHVAEIDTVAQIGKEPEVPVQFQRFGAVESDDGRNMLAGKGSLTL